MNQLEIKKIFLVALVLNLILGAISQLDFFWHRILGFEGFYAGIASAGFFLIILLPLCALLSGIIATTLSSTRRVATFFTGVFVSLLLSAVLVSIITNYNRAKSADTISQMYAEDPQQRPIGDPLRPVTIAIPGARPYDTKPGEVINVTVLALYQPEFNEGLPIELVILSKSARNTMLNREVVTLGKLIRTNEAQSAGQVTFTGRVTVPAELAGRSDVTDIFLVAGEMNKDVLPLRLTGNHAMINEGTH